MNVVYFNYVPENIENVNATAYILIMMPNNKVNVTSYSWCDAD